MRTSGLFRSSRAATAAVLLSVSSSVAAQTKTSAPLGWYKGNTHTHTLNSDGDSTPDDVVRWYREHDYDFVVLTDHNFLTSVDGLNALHGADERFLVVKGEEVTVRFEKKDIHINGLDVSARVEPQHGSSVLDVMQRNVDAIRKVNGIPHVNHPNFTWSIAGDALRQLRNSRLFEIFNGHPSVNNLGGGGVPGLEEVWDTILTSGVLLYGIAVDDAHYFKQPGNPDVPGPGRGWVVVRAPRLEARALVEALDRGEFYASTGVELADYTATPRQIVIKIKPRGDARYRVQFIGTGGRLLREATEPTATYDIRGDEGYVRAKVIDSNGRYAWSQPIMVAARPSALAGAPGLISIVLLTVGAGLWRRRALRSTATTHRANHIFRRESDAPVPAHSGFCRIGGVTDQSDL